MYSDKIKPVRENFYRQSILFAIMLLGIVVIAFFTCIKREEGLHGFVVLFTTLNAVSLLSVVCLTLVVVYFLRYRYYVRKRNDFLTKGSVYSGKIVDTIIVKNWFGQARARNYKMVIRYEDKEFVTPVFEPDLEYMIAANTCNVYVIDGKCYASDFVVERKGKGQDDFRKPVGVKAEDYLYSSIHPEDFDRKKFIEGRVSVVLGRSDQYIMPIPRPVVFQDGVAKSVVIDIAIESSKKVEVFTTFEDELTEYIRTQASEMSSEQLPEFNELLKEKLWELLHSYYYFVKVKSVEVGEIS